MQDDTKMTRPRGRPLSHDPAVTLRKIADTFREKGYSATSLDDVSRNTGLNRPSLYATFGDKKAMYLSALERLREDLKLNFGRLERADLSFGQMLKALMANSIEKYLAGESGPNGCLAVGTASAEAVADPDIRKSLNEVLTLIDDSIAALFKRYGAPNAKSQGRMLAAALHSISVRARSGQPRALLEEMGRDALKLVVPPPKPARRL